MKMKYQQGGLFTLPYVVYQPISTFSESRQYEQNSSKKSDSGVDMADVYKLLDDLKEVLPGDLEATKSRLMNIFSSIELKTQHSSINPGIGDTSSIAYEYLTALNLVNKMKFAHNEYKVAKEQAIKSGSINEYAINSRGQVIVASEDGFEWKTPEEIFESNGEYTPITNQELLDYRAQGLGGLAFNSDVLQTVSNGLGMTDITKTISDSITNLGTNAEQQQGYARVKAGQMISGLQDFIKAKDKSGNYNATVEDLYKAGLLTEDQTYQAKLALNYIYNTLSPTAITLLKMKSDGTAKGAQSLIDSLVYSKLSNKTALTGLDLEKSSTTAKIDNLNEMDMNPVSMIEAGYGQKSKITIQTKAGNNKGLQVDVISMPITNRSGDSLGSNITFEDVTKSVFAGYINTEQVSMGGVMLDSTGFDKVTVNGANFNVTYLPVDLVEYNDTGNIKPDIDMLERYNDVQKHIKENNIIDKDQINQLYMKNNLPIFYDGKGDVTINYIKFGILNGNALDTAFREDATFADWLYESYDKNEITNVLDIINKGRGGNNQIDFDVASGWDKTSPIFNRHNSMYRGTIFFPVNQDYFTYTATTGQYPTTGEAQIIEAKQQNKNRAAIANQIYHNPGNLL